MNKNPDDASKTDVVHIRVNTQMAKALSKLAKSATMSKSQAIRRLLEDALVKRGLMRSL